QLEALNEDLATLAAEGRLREIPGVGEAISQKIQELIETGGLRYFERLKAEVPPTLIDLLQIPGLGPRKIQVLRRELGIASIADVDFVCAADQPEQVLDCFVGLPAVKEVLGRGPTKASVLTFQNLQMDLRVVPPSSYGAALQYFTGSKAHNVKLRTLAQRKG